jgi:hypothetical protein
MAADKGKSAKLDEAVEAVEGAVCARVEISLEVVLVIQYFML